MAGPRSDPPIPMLTTLRTRLPVWPVHAPERTCSEKSAILVEHRVHARYDILAVDVDRLALGRTERDVQHRRGPRRR